LRQFNLVSHLLVAVEICSRHQRELPGTIWIGGKNPTRLGLQSEQSSWKGSPIKPIDQRLAAG
jgi:hypothetical protein